MMLRVIFIFILIAVPAFAKSVPDFNALKKSWEKIDTITINKSAGDKYSAAARKGKSQTARDLYMIIPDNPEMLLWFFHGYKPEGDPHKQSPEIFIKNMGLKELSSWHNALIVIVDSGTSLYWYNPDSGIPELQLYCTIYDRLAKQYGTLPAIVAGVSSGAEGAVKFAPFVSKLKSLICISGTYNFDSLMPKSNEYKIHLKEYGSAAEWEYEQPLRIFPVLRCRVIMLSEEKSIYRSQAAEANRVLKMKNLEFIEAIGKGKSHDWDFWGSEEVKKIINREIQAAGAY
ncbi:MAG: hypothetical protein JXN64_01085 [Spirochaetes bacterium]|nr:hypothetical protein [Spirochaetota bacterium]